MRGLVFQPTVRDRTAERLADLAVAALIDEATLTPKPGLVDSRGSGAHTDLTLDLMCRSARALRPAFVAMATYAWDRETNVDLRETLAAIGRRGEAAMFAASGGTNTHRGAIWALGLLLAAAAQDLGELAPAAVAARAGAIARLPDRQAPHALRKGEIACRSYRVSGARGEAQSGFPHVIDDALPTLRASRRQGDSETCARLNALLSIMARLDDTCVLSRGGPPALAAMHAGARAVLDRGGAGSLAGRRALRELERQLLAANASPGGAADLLAATLLLDRVTGAF